MKISNAKAFGPQGILWPETFLVFGSSWRWNDWNPTFRVQWTVSFSHWCWLPPPSCPRDLKKTMGHGPWCHGHRAQTSFKLPTGFTAWICLNSFTRILQWHRPHRTLLAAIPQTMLLSPRSAAALLHAARPDWLQSRRIQKLYFVRTTRSWMRCQWGPLKIRLYSRCLLRLGRGRSRDTVQLGMVFFHQPQLHSHRIKIRWVRISQGLGKRHGGRLLQQKDTKSIKKQDCGTSFKQ